EIADDLRCPVGTAKTHVRRGLERMRAHLARAGMALSLTAVAGALSGLQAATAATGLSATSGLLVTSTKASPFVLSGTAGGMIGFAKIAAIAIAVTAVASAPFVLRKNKIPETPVDPAPLSASVAAHGD